MAEDFFVQLRSWGPIKENQAALLRKKISDPNWAGDSYCFLLCGNNIPCCFPYTVGI
jgi:hypothetical protein